MLAEIIKEIAGQWQDEEHAYYPRPSIAGKERCTRQMVYWGANLPKEKLPGRSLLVMDDSSWHEDLTADWIRKSVYALHSEQMHINIFGMEHLNFLPERKCDRGTCDKKIPAGCIAGHIDGIITDITGKDYLWEHKAINHFTWNKYHAGTIPHDYVSQCCMYLRGLKQDNTELESAILLMKNKNTAAYLELLIAYDYDTDTATVKSMTDSNNVTVDINEVIENAAQDCFKKFKYVDTCIFDKVLPKREYMIGDDWQCDYCGWQSTCWKGYKKEFEELKTNEMLPEDVAVMLRYYKELGGQKGDIEKEYKELAEKIKQFMKGAGAREGRAGEFIVKLSLMETARIDKSMLTADEINKATVKSMYERLYVSTPKTKEPKND
jgi:hypothetical protein